VLPRRRANKSQPVALRHFSHWPRRIGSVGKREAQVVSGARRGLRYDRAGLCRKVKSEGTKERERVVGKAAGDECVFILAKADEVGFDAMPDAAGGEAVTGPLNWKG
jgi:hypothetical protein